MLCARESITVESVRVPAVCVATFSSFSTEPVVENVPPTQFCTDVLLKYVRLKLSVLVPVVAVFVRENRISEASVERFASTAD